MRDDEPRDDEYTGWAHEMNRGLPSMPQEALDSVAQIYEDLKEEGVLQEPPRLCAGRRPQQTTPDQQ